MKDERHIQISQFNWLCAMIWTWERMFWIWSIYRERKKPWSKSRYSSSEKSSIPFSSWLCMFLPLDYKSHIHCQLFSKYKTDVFRLISYLAGRHWLWLISVRFENHLKKTWDMLYITVNYMFPVASSCSKCSKAFDWQVLLSESESKTTNKQTLKTWWEGFRCRSVLEHISRGHS